VITGKEIKVEEII
jgi:hypothetical protein